MSSSLSRKHYEATAGLLGMVADESTRVFLVRAFANMFAEDNVRFDRSRFEVACEVAYLATAVLSGDQPGDDGVTVDHWTDHSSDGVS